ncbi:unnamed protein product [Peniophora sp. CBMAI 1063]|nr:unnamed protein product [Peniophora sp. CBMAI 1063]
MIAKLVVHGPHRESALRLLSRALEEYRVVGVHTNVELRRLLASHPKFIEGDVDTGFIPVQAQSKAPPTAITAKPRRRSVGSVIRSPPRPGVSAVSD